MGLHGLLQGQLLSTHCFDDSVRFNIGRCSVNCSRKRCVQEQFYSLLYLQRGCKAVWIPGVAVQTHVDLQQCAQLHFCRCREVERVPVVTLPSHRDLQKYAFCWLAVIAEGRKFLYYFRGPRYRNNPYLNVDVVMSIYSFSWSVSERKGDSGNRDAGCTVTTESLAALVGSLIL
jgi:hypothetical protein